MNQILIAALAAPQRLPCVRSRFWSDDVQVPLGSAIDVVPRAATAWAVTDGTTVLVERLNEFMTYRVPLTIQGCSVPTTRVRVSACPTGHAIPGERSVRWGPQAVLQVVRLHGVSSGSLPGR